MDGPSPDTDLARRRRNFAQRRSLSEYAVSLPNQPTDLLGNHPNDDKFRFFKKGRDFQPRKAKHHFTEEELRVLETYESAAILPSHTEVYKKWLETEPARGGFESWGIIFVVAVSIGTLAFIMKWTCEKLQIFDNPLVTSAFEAGNVFHVWIYYSALSCCFSAFSAIVVVYFSPFSAGSGLPEIIGILNGCVVRNVLSLNTLVCKIVSVILTVISSLPVGFEGPMIHIGGMVGACMARPLQLCFRVNKSKKSDSCKNGKINSSNHCFSRLCRYRDCQERYSLICVGAASGVASAFSSPISGLTFAMEEISSQWSKSQTWRTFVCCILARSTTELLHSLVGSFGNTEPGNSSKMLQMSESALFDMKRTLDLSMVIFIPALIIGALGGFLGAVFIFMHLKMSKFRRRFFARIKRPQIVNLSKVLEVILLALLCSIIIMASVPYIPCRSVDHEQSVSRGHGRKSLILRSFDCKVPLQSSYKDGKIIQTGEYHEGASLLFGSWEQMIRNLFSRKTSQFFGIPVLFLCFFIFWFLSSWTSMTSIASGLLIPQLAIGALYGRIIGETLFLGLKKYMGEADENVIWDWVDPGAFALMGAASFLSGTSRLPITSVVMMVEMTNDINMSLLIMVCVMLSKFVGDLFTHSLYHSTLEFKCIPYLESDLKVYHDGKRVSLELFSASDVMKTPVDVVNVEESVRYLANLLLDTNHGAFPVVQSGIEGFDKTFLGIITRLELTILLTKTERFDPKEIENEDMDRLRLSYPEYSSTRLKDTDAANVILNKYCSSMMYANIYVNLMPYINKSTPSVTKVFSLRRAHSIFTTMGLRHLVVTDTFNQVVGIITRKDLMGFAIESRVKGVLRSRKARWIDHSQTLDLEEDIRIGLQSTVVQEETSANYEKEIEED